GGRPPLLEFVNNSSIQGTAEDSGISVRPVDLLYQFIWTIPAVLVGAGWPVARRFREALVRLGMVRPTTVQVAAGVGLGLLLAFVGNFVLDPGIRQLWTTMGWPTTDVGAFSQLLSKVTTPLGAVLIGVT